MYPLNVGLWGPTVRITHLRRELEQLVDLELIEGYRGARRRQLWRYAVSGRLRGLDGIYVEASSFLPAESDIAFLALAKSLGIPVVTFFRDAYQLFPDYYPIDSARRWVSARLFVPAMRALAAASTRLAVPTQGLGAALFGEGADVLLMPPGSPPRVDAPYDPRARELLFVGDARLDAQGAGLLMRAVASVRQAWAPIGLTMVVRPGQEPPEPHPDWLHLERGSAEEIHRILPGIVASIIPRPRGAYNDLALPIKLFDYLSYARPILVTACQEQARVVSSSGAGLVISDDPEGMANDIARFLSLPDRVRLSMANSAGDAANEVSWRSRAVAIVEALGLKPMPSPATVRRATAPEGTGER